MLKWLRLKNAKKDQKLFHPLDSIQGNIWCRVGKFTAVIKRCNWSILILKLGIKESKARALELLGS